MVIDPKFDRAFSFTGGLAIIYIDENYWYINPNGRIISEACSIC